MKNTKDSKKVNDMDNVLAFFCYLIGNTLDKNNIKYKSATIDNTKTIAIMCFKKNKDEVLKLINEMFTNLFISYDSIDELDVNEKCCQLMIRNISYEEAEDTENEEKTELADHWSGITTPDPDTYMPSDKEPEVDYFEYAVFDKDDNEIEIYETLDEAIAMANEIENSYVTEYGYVTTYTEFGPDDYEVDYDRLYEKVVYENKK